MELVDYRFSLRKKDGGIQLILSYKDANGKWRQKSRQGFPTETAARRHKDELLTAARDELAKSRTGGEMTMRDFFENYFLPDITPSLSYGSAVKYRFTVAQLAPLSDMPLRSITAADFQNQLALLRSRLAVSTARAAASFGKRLLAAAVFPFGFIAESPAAHVSINFKQREKKQVKALTDDELERLLTALRGLDATFYAFAALLAFSGLRYSEGAGLCWPCVDFEKSEIKIEKQFGKVAAGVSDFKRLKTLNSYRVVPLSPRLSEILLEYREEYDVGERVFPPELLSYKSFRKAVSKFAPGFSPHSLRHTFATRLLQRGADVQTVAALIGDTVAMTVKTYISFNDDMRRAAASFVEKASK